MDQADEMTIYWEAVAVDRNIERAFSVSLTRDLFGWVILERRWGKKGRRSSMRRQAFALQADAIVALDRISRRRATAKCRIGVPYKVVHADQSARVAEC